MKKLREYSEKFTHYGVKDSMPISVQKKIILTNQMAMVMFFLLLIMVFLLYFFDYNDHPFNQAPAIFTLLIIPIMNRFGQYRVTTFTLSSLSPIFVLFFSTISKTDMPEIDLSAYIFPKMLIMSMAILPLILIDTRRKALMVIALMINLGYLYLYDPVHEWAGLSWDKVDLHIDRYVYLNYFMLVPYGLILLGSLHLDRITRIGEKRIFRLVKELEDKNREIMDSIHYASRIQTAVLPDNMQISHLLPEHFIFWKPRDVVSGDFYWVVPLRSGTC